MNNLSEQESTPSRSLKANLAMMGAVLLWVLLVGFFFWRLFQISEADAEVQSAALKRCADQDGVAFISGGGDRILCADKDAILFEMPGSL